jgi:3-methylcrotonyl-CoA carboxylase alpha subunit
VRIARTCHALGVRVVAVYSEADRTALHVRAADEAYCIGPAPARESYLNIDAILAVAKESGAEAIHPGYGFLSENAEFSERVTAGGIVFIGPPAEAIRAMGDKAEAKRLMEAAGVPVVPGYQGEDQSDARLTAEAERIGLPLLIKAAAGGGGRGMRAVSEPAQFAEQLAGARREALSAFGDDRVLLERLVQRGRHVEVQVFADQHGNCVYLGERDCSAQRRHQKVVEEAPSPAVDADLRRRMGEAAVRAARRVGYTNAGTVEFLLAERGEFYFLEMNTRLQVEHPVTELITGLDLVELQLRVAAGEPLPFAQENVQFRGHAIEARLYAEDPFHGYLPSTGRIERFDLPAGEGVRVDGGFNAGASVSPYYDAMLAKIIACGADREQARERLLAVLDAADVQGVQTNLPLLRAVVASAAFAAGAVTTDFLEPFWEREQANAADGFPRDLLLGAAALTIAGMAGDTPDPWRTLGPWRVSAAPRTLRFRHGSAVAALTVAPAREANVWRLQTDGGEVACRIEPVGANELLAFRGHELLHVRLLERDGGTLRLQVGEAQYEVAMLATPAPDVAAGGREGAASGRLTAPMPGVIVRLAVSEGQCVQAHQTLAVLEAMKMEHAIQAPADGVVSKVHVAEGSRVAGGASVIDLEL